MSLPKIKHDLLNTNLTTIEKIDYIKARCLISACLHAESGSVIFKKEQSAIDTLNKLNKKMKDIPLNTRLSFNPVLFADIDKA